MNIADVKTLLPFIIIAATAIVVMLMIAVHRSHRVTAFLTLLGLALAFAALPALASLLPRKVTPLIILDHYAFFYTGLIVAASFAVAALSFSYLEQRKGHHEEFYILLLLGTLGAAVLTAANHFAAFFLGLETLTVSLYGLTAYDRSSERSIEAGVKYLILAAVSSAFILFGMALLYAETGSMEFARIASPPAGADVHGLVLIAGLALIIIGIGFKLAVVPFHLWTPDVYEGAPAPVTAIVATVSKGAVFALVLRFFSAPDVHARGSLMLIFTLIAIASMFAGTILALLQQNVKRILAYSSISHLGYLLVAILASGERAAGAAAFYLVAYFVTTLGAFGIVTVLSSAERDADRLDDYRGLAWHRPWIAAVFTAMLLSLAGIPLTAGFVGKIYLVAAGVGSALWLLVIVLVVNSAIGLYYYLRVVAAMFAQPLTLTQACPVSTGFSAVNGAVLAVLTLALIALGVYPGPVLEIIKTTAQGLL